LGATAHGVGWLVNAQCRGRHDRSMWGQSRERANMGWVARVQSVVHGVGSVGWLPGPGDGPMDP
jgi:hypothetical protein